MSGWDLIVLGTGGVGSAAICHAAGRGLRALGLDRFPAAHAQGSSHGETRIIRQAYFEHPDYVPLAQRAFELWRELESLVGRPLLFPVGLLQVGPPDGRVVPGVLESARRHRLDVEPLTATVIAARFPGFTAPPEWSGVLERGAGYLLVEQCVRAYLGEARRTGAELREGVDVRGWRSARGTIRVETDRGTLETERLVVTAGPWAGQLLADLDLGLRVLRKHVYWFEPDGDSYDERRGAPTFLYETSDGVYYGFPQRGTGGVKAAEHSGGVEVADPRSDPREPDATDERRVRGFLERFLPRAPGRVIRREVCHYTMSRDENFVVDRHPRDARVVFAAGLSGHGFKFASALGEALVELACDGRTRLPLGFLGSGLRGSVGSQSGESRSAEPA